MAHLEMTEAAEPFTEAPPTHADLFCEKWGRQVTTAQDSQKGLYYLILYIYIIYTYICEYTYTYVYIHMCIYICVNTDTYTYTDT